MAGDPNEQRGMQFMEEAKKKLNSSTGLITRLLGGGWEINFFNLIFIIINNS